MAWYYIVLLCIISCWFGIFLMAVVSVSKCKDCKAHELNNKTLKCRKCGINNLHITNRFKFTDNTEDFVVICHTCGTEYELPNSIKE